jgi:predicted dehydrogenase
MKKDKYRVVVAGFAHVHINGVAAHFAAHPRLELCAGADLPPLVPELKTAPYTRQWNLNFCAEKFGFKVHQDWLAMLDSENPDLCVVNSENTYHPLITEACARRGIGVCIEKPMAASLSDGLKMHRSALTHGIFLMVNWPITWNPGLHMVKKLIDQGRVGDIIEVKTRMGHTGPLGPGAKHRGVTETAAPMTEFEKASTWWHQAVCGGGAMADYCCYGAMLASWFTGRPALSVSGMRINSITTMGDAEDNAALMVRFADLYAVVEGTWTTYDHTFSSPIVYGTQGAIVGDYKTGKVRFHGADGSVEQIENDPLPPELADEASAYVHHMDTGAPLHLTAQPEFNLNALAILDAGIKSAGSGRVEPVENIHWHIG